MFSLRLFLYLFFFSCFAQAAQQEITAATLLPESFKGENPNWRYLLHLPKGYEDSKESWPLIVYLHGRSIRGNNLNQLKRYGPPAFLDRKPDFPFVVVSPQLPEQSWPSQSLLQLLDEVERTYRVDSNRIYLTGVSMGGGGSWYLAAANAKRFAALAPVCGYGHTSLAKKLTKLPIWAFHGDADSITPIGPHQALVDAVNAVGGNAKMTVIPGGTHGDIIVPTYKRQELYDWMLSHRRGGHIARLIKKPTAPIIKAVRIVKAGPSAMKKVTPEPAPKAKKIAGEVGKTYTVEPGDSLWGIGRKHGVSVRAIKAANRLTSDRIYAGQDLKIP